MPGPARKMIDCRDFPNDQGCTLMISGTEEEVLLAAVHHAITVHGHQNLPELRAQLRSMLKDEGAPKARSASA